MQQPGDGVRAGRKAVGGTKPQIGGRGPRAVGRGPGAEGRLQRGCCVERRRMVTTDVPARDMQGGVHHITLLRLVRDSLGGGTRGRWG